MIDSTAKEAVRPGERRRIVLASIDPWTGGDHLRPFDYGARRIAAAVRGSAKTSEAWDVSVLSRRDLDVDAFVGEIAALEPDVVGFSTYVWSLATFALAAEKLAALPRPPVVVMGGPSARPVSFAREPLRSLSKFVHALCLGDGEEIIVELLGLASLSRDALAGIDGLAVPGPFGFRGTPRAARTSLDELPSPYQLGIVPRETTAHLEIFRGCPLRCVFCQWGRYDGERIASEAHLVRELEAIARLDPRGVFLVDAGLNLSTRAFRALADAERAVGLLARTTLSCELYPAYVRPEQLDFLAGTRAAVGIGIQSIDPEVLRGLDRPPTDLTKVASVVRDVSGVAEVLLEVIVGLPGDSPDGFWRTLEWARALGTSVNAYQCLALPDALLDRATGDDRYDVDPTSFALRRAPGWTEAALGATRARLDAEARSSGDTSVAGVWHFPATRRRRPAPQRALDGR